MSNPARKMFRPKLSAYVDGELSPEERVQVEQHLQVNKESAMEVADMRAASGLTRVSMDMLADEVDWKQFTNNVMSQLQPTRLPLMERLSISLGEMFRYQRPVMVTAMVTAAVVALLLIPLALQRSAPGYANETMKLEAVRSDDVKVRPVVLETKKGDAIIFMMDAPAEATPPAGNDEAHEELEVEPAPQKKGGSL